MPKASATGLLVRNLTLLLILSVLLLLFSTVLWIDIPIAYGIYVGDIIVVVLAVLIILKLGSIVSPLTTIISRDLNVNTEKVGNLILHIAWFVSLAIAYYGFKRVYLLLATRFLDLRHSFIVYDAVFIILAAYLVYSLVRSYTG